MNTNENALAKSQGLGAQIEQVLIQGNLAQLSPEQRVSYYNAVCESVGLNPLTRPFEYLTLNGKLVLYARKDAADQLRRIHGVSIKIVAREVVEGVYVVTAQASTATRCDESIGAVPIDNLKGEVRANAIMKAESKAKRRVTLSIAGLGMLDENEVDSIPGARVEPMETTLISSPPPLAAIVHARIAAANAERKEDHESAQPIIDEEYTEPVDVFDAPTGEHIKQEPKLTSAQLAKIHILKKQCAHHLDDAKYRKYLVKEFSKDSSGLLSIREANKVIDMIQRKVDKLAKTMNDRTEAFATDIAAAAKEDLEMMMKQERGPSGTGRIPGEEG